MSDKVDGLQETILQLTKGRDELRAENERLKTVPMKYRRMAFNAQLQDENKRLEAEVAELRAENERLTTEAVEWKRASDTYFIERNSARDMYVKYRSLCEQAEAKLAVVEQLRPVWAQGYSSDSVAAQTAFSAMASAWKAVGVNSQTNFMQRLEVLLKAEAKLAELDEALAWGEKLHSDLDLYRYFDLYSDALKVSLAITPPAALTELKSRIRDDVLEEAAEWFDSQGYDDSPVYLRAMKKGT